MEKQTTEPTPAPVAPETKTTSRIMTKSFGVICLLILLVLLLGGYFVVNEKSRNKAVAPTIAPTVATATASPSASPTSSATPAAELKTYASLKLKDISFSGYSLKHPSDWIETSTRDESVGTAKLKLEKGSYSIVIQQGPMGGSQCVYKDSDVPGGAEPMFLDKRGKPYLDLLTSFGTLRRDEEIGGSGEIGYSFCQESDSEKGTFGSFTKVGAMSYGGPAKWDSSVLLEMDSIVRSIQLLP